MQIHQMDLLPALFSRVLIPPAVRDELLRAHPELPAWLEIQAPRSIPELISAARLDRGEIEALALALEMRADIILMDERLGRDIARNVGLRVVGLLGLLVFAKERGQIPAVRPLVESLQTRAGCWFHDDLIAQVYRSVSE